MPNLRPEVSPATSGTEDENGQITPNWPWMVLGLIVLGYFTVRDRSRIAETQRVFTEETPAERESATRSGR